MGNIFSSTSFSRVFNPSHVFFTVFVLIGAPVASTLILGELTSTNAQDKVEQERSIFLVAQTSAKKRPLL